jgi:hypothetical protein
MYGFRQYVLNEEARVHIAARQRGGRMAVRGARAAASHGEDHYT